MTARFRVRLIFTGILGLMILMAAPASADDCTDFLEQMPEDIYLDREPFKAAYVLTGRCSNLPIPEECVQASEDMNMLTPEQHAQAAVPCLRKVCPDVDVDSLKVLDGELGAQLADSCEALESSEILNSETANELHVNGAMHWVVAESIHRAAVAKLETRHAAKLATMLRIGIVGDPDAKPLPDDCKESIASMTQELPPPWEVFKQYGETCATELPDECSTAATELKEVPDTAWVNGVKGCFAVVCPEMKEASMSDVEPFMRSFPTECANVDSTFGRQSWVRPLQVMAWVTAETLMASTPGPVAKHWQQRIEWLLERSLETAGELYAR